MKTSLMKPLMMLALIGVYDRDHNTNPEVVITSKPSSMTESMPAAERNLCMCEQYAVNGEILGANPEHST